MNNQIKRVRIIVLLGAAVASILFVHALIISIFAVHYISYDFDERLSPQACAAITNCVQACQHNGHYNLTTILDELPRSCGSIKSVSLMHLPHHTAQLKVTTFDPIITVNGDKILLENSRIVSAAHYADFVKNRLYHIAIADNPSFVTSTITDALVHAVHEKLFEHYTFTIKSADEWYLRDKHDPLFTICCNAISLPEGTLYDQYAQLKKKIHAHQKLKTTMIADVRFNHQIILSHAKRGQYGKGIS